MEHLRVAATHHDKAQVPSHPIHKTLSLDEQRLQLTAVLEATITAPEGPRVIGVRNSLLSVSTRVQAAAVLRASVPRPARLPTGSNGSEHHSIPMGHQDMTVTRTEHPHIIRDPRIGEGEPIIAGTSIRVRILVEYWRLGTSPENLLQSFPHLTLAQVFDALSYYQDHQEEIHTLMAQNRVDPALLHESVRQLP